MVMVTMVMVTKVHMLHGSYCKEMKTTSVFNEREKGSAVGNNTKQTPRGCQSKHSTVMIPIAIGVLTQTMARIEFIQPLLQWFYMHSFLSKMNDVI